jgi:hypothetical protein
MTDLKLRKIKYNTKLSIEKTHLGYREAQDRKIVCDRLHIHVLIFLEEMARGRNI